MFSISLVLVSNSFFTIKNLKKDYFITLELKSDITKDEIQKFEEELLKDTNIKAIKFLGREEALTNLQKEYEIIIPKAENPLPNSLLLSFDNNQNLKAIQETYDVDKRVREIYFDEKFYKLTKNKIVVFHIFLIIGVCLTAISLFQIGVLLKNVIVTEYILFSIKNSHKKNSFQIAKNRNYFKLVGGAILSLLLFFNLYVILSKKIQVMIPAITYQSFKEIFYFQVIAYIIALVLLNRLANRIKKIEV